jgi:hypothetical protein
MPSGRKPTHGGRYLPEYTVWADMRRRCLNTTRKDYARYGGRGITICDRWINSFANFLADMGPRPSPQHSIERRDNDAGYSPENCFWATPIEQGRNKRDTAWLTLNGVRRSLAEWAEVTGIDSNTIFMRIHNCGWSVEKALTTPVRSWGPGRKKPT